MHRNLSLDGFPSSLFSIAQSFFSLEGTFIISLQHYSDEETHEVEFNHM